MEENELKQEAIIKLIQGCKNNDGDAYNELLSYYEGYLYRICFNFTRSQEEALDIMQEVYIKIFRAIKSFDERRPFLPWLKKITINTLINYGKTNRRSEYSLEGKWEQFESKEVRLSPEQYLAARDNPEGAVILKDTHQVIDKLIAELPQRYRLPLILRYYEEMTYEQIAVALKQPLGTVKSSVYRARSQLRNEMLACGLLEV